MANRYESSRIAEKKSMQEIKQAIWELATKAEGYAKTSCLWSVKAAAAVTKARQILGK